MFKTQYAKVVDSTFNPLKETKEMIGGIYEVRTIEFIDKKIALFTKNKSDFWWFNFSDVLPATEEEYKAQFEKKGEIEELKEQNCDEDGEISPIKMAPSQWDIFQKVNELVRAVNKIKQNED